VSLFDETGLPRSVTDGSSAFAGASVAAEAAARRTTGEHERGRDVAARPHGGRARKGGWAPTSRVRPSRGKGEGSADRGELLAEAHPLLPPPSRAEPFGEHESTGAREHGTARDVGRWGPPLGATWGCSAIESCERLQRSARGAQRSARPEGANAADGATAASSSASATRQAPARRPLHLGVGQRGRAFDRFRQCTCALDESPNRCSLS